MKARKKEVFFICLFLAVIFLMLFYSITSETFHVSFKADQKPELNERELVFVEQKKQINIAVDEELGFFPDTFLKEFMSRVFEPSGLEIKVLENSREEDADAALVVANEDSRAKSSDMIFTAALFQLTGSLFVKAEDELPETGSLKGVCVKDQFTKEEKRSLSYNGQGMQLEEAASAQEAVKIAKKKHLDCILGEQEAITGYLKEAGIQNRYQNTYADFYKSNVCLTVHQSNQTLYSILNQCIHEADLQILMGQTQEQWFGIADSLVQKERYKDVTTLLIIVFAAVFFTFFFYYQSNKNLYNELTARMNQLTASKKEMQTTFNGVSYYMAELDPNGIVIDMNKAFLGYVRNESIGKHITEVLELAENPALRIRELLKKTEQTGYGASDEITLKRNILEVNIFPISNIKGKIEKLLFMAEDVTGERMAERQMLQDNKMIAVGQLAAGVAHEIRNPLGIIRNYCYVLKTMKDEETQAQAVQVIEKSVDAAGNIIDNLLNFSRISKKMIGSVYIREHIDSVISLNKGLLKKKQITVSIQCEEDFEVEMAVESFDMILMNLITNAIDAMEEEGQLTIAICKEGEEFYTEVSDTGTGIEEDILDDIFNSFFTTKSSTQGNGLGLYIVYNEVQKMNGEIKVSSRSGQGTTFKVTLPIQVRMEEKGKNEQGKF